METILCLILFLFYLQRNCKDICAEKISEKSIEKCNTKPKRNVRSTRLVLLQGFHGKIGKGNQKDSLLFSASIKSSIFGN